MRPAAIFFAGSIQNLPVSGSQISIQIVCNTHF